MLLDLPQCVEVATEDHQTWLGGLFALRTSKRHHTAFRTTAAEDLLARLAAVNGVSALYVSTVWTHDVLAHLYLQFYLSCSLVHFDAEV